MTNGRMAGKVAVVTGAGSGIGKASAILLAAEGAKVALLELTTDTAEQTKQEIEKAGGEALVIECDVSRPESVQTAIQRVGEVWDKSMSFSPMRESMEQPLQSKRWKSKIGTARWRRICAVRLLRSNMRFPF